MADHLNQMLIHGLIISLIASAWLLMTLWINPRLFLQDYPQPIQAKVPPKNKQEKLLSYWLGVPFILILLIGPFISTLSVANQIGGKFLDLWFYAAGVIFIFNLLDWLILDWLIFCTITPRFMVIPGSEGMKAYKDYNFHFIGFLKGTIISLIGGLLIAAFVYII